MNRVFVTGATGAQGHAITQVLNRKNIAVSSISRGTSHSNALLNIEKGDITDLTHLAHAMSGSEAVIFTLPLIFDYKEVEKITQSVIAASKMQGIKKIIFNTSIALGSKKTGCAAIDVKHKALSLLNASDLDIITLMSTLYLDNLTTPFLLPIIQKDNIIPYPVDNNFKLAWISQENLGRYCLAALKNDDLIGQKILITNKDKITGDDLANIISYASKKSINYIALQADQFEENLKKTLGNDIAKEIANLYKAIDKHRDDFESYSSEDFIASTLLETTQEWANHIAW